LGFERVSRADRESATRNKKTTLEEQRGSHGDGDEIIRDK